MQKTIDDKIEHVKQGYTLTVFTPLEIAELQEYALDKKDMKLYDYLEKYWERV